MLIALDTNILVYAEGIAFLPGDVEKPVRVHGLLDALPADGVVLPTQVLGELYRVLVGKAKRPVADASRAIMTWRDLYPQSDTTATVMMAAIDLAADHKLSIWDAVVVSAAAEAGCRLLLSEDMQDGFTWRGLTVVNPFSAKPHPLLEALTG
ncbi:PIN domain-containing protein [Azospirillum sp. TSO22-1]|uniref:PIN domain-containing protein n=1 Tax=Azospirillum sp. TSO22-1 TaxID=716789 RepID=UPI000D61CCC5|nr:PIN domain-containing protein [Azospirillum sp. TSO22-1]PWC42804.1 twitching motility protein PilT [Azospirillum sp. TSO22-1]